MYKSYNRLVMTAFIIMGLATPVFGQNGSDEARKHLVRGMAAIEMSKSEDGLAAAAVEFAKAIEIEPNMALAWYNLGLVQSKMGQLKDAIASYRRYLILVPKADDARLVNDEIIKLEYRVEREEARVLKRDGRFIVYVDGTVLDTKTNLMWAAKDNGDDINWTEAKTYCENYRGGGYMDWRMPKYGELASLYDVGKTYESACGSEVHLTELIQLACRMYWASETRIDSGTDMAFIFSFDGTSMGACDQTGCFGRQLALPVRSAK